MTQVQIEDLLLAGSHFGHLTRRWDPKMKKYIFMERNGIHIIDLKKTLELLIEACNSISKISTDGKKVLFIGTKKQAKQIIKDEAERSGSFYVCERWLGGMLTNFNTVRKSIKKLTNIQKMETDGTIDQFVKKERLILSRDKEKLEKVLNGIVSMTKLPGAIFVVDIKKEHIAISEARKLNIPVYAIVDTNCDPDLVDYPIPANDDAVKSIQIITKAIADAAIVGTQVAKIKAEDESEEMKEKLEKR
ncbi:MAG TPA: 30S ribosomal protein S2 [Ignavibacteria bacterium]|nr:30S ribosomal protein S2 [Ignavibacteria bacterium]HQY52704.1 30S ribosomal protein S2 [Ignavibacteria bacterium]HRA98872.1 30S ribosomal protein S2 [Ignavibacteria bacterium]